MRERHHNSMFMNVVSGLTSNKISKAEEQDKRRRREQKKRQREYLKRYKRH